MRILICTNDVTFNASLSANYRARGWSVHVGTADFFLRQVNYDIIHFHWPEELTAWKVPADLSEISLVLDGLAWWKDRAKLICTVHNLLPHGAKPNDRRTREYYLKF